MRSRTLQRADALTRLTLRFARVERVTRHEDGIRPETDSDHTVMLGIVACDLADDLAPIVGAFDRGMVAQFALVHDIVEAYAGDVQTLTIDAAGRAAKADREAAAVARLTEEFGAESWLVRCLTKYEAQDTAEARYVRVLDKVLPKLTHTANGCCAAVLLTDRDGFAASHAAQLRKLRDEYPEFYMYGVLLLLAESMRASEAAWPTEAA